MKEVDLNKFPLFRIKEKGYVVVKIEYYDGSPVTFSAEDGSETLVSMNFEEGKGEVLTQPKIKIPQVKLKSFKNLIKKCRCRECVIKDFEFLAELIQSCKKIGFKLNDDFVKQEADRLTVEYLKAKVEEEKKK